MNRRQIMKWIPALFALPVLPAVAKPKPNMRQLISEAMRGELPGLMKPIMGDRGPELVMPPYTTFENGEVTAHQISGSGQPVVICDMVAVEDDELGTVTITDKLTGGVTIIDQRKNAPPIEQERRADGSIHLRIKGRSI